MYGFSTEKVEVIFKLSVACIVIGYILHVTHISLPMPALNLEPKQVLNKIMNVSSSSELLKIYF